MPQAKRVELVCCHSNSAPIFTQATKFTEVDGVTVLMPSQRYSLVLPVSPNHVKICWLKEFNQGIAGCSYQLASMKWIDAWLNYIMGMLQTCLSMISCRR